MFACLHWVSNNSAPGSIDGQPYMPPDGILPSVNGVHSLDNNAVQSAYNNSGNTEVQSPTGVNGVSVSAATPMPTAEQATEDHDYEATLRELAQDLVVKERQIELLMKDLPGLNSSQIEQESRIKQTEDEAKSLEDQAQHAARTRETLIQRVEETMLRVRRV